MAAEVLRARTDEAPRVTNMELFFDLVYVFAITQLSEFLYRHLTARGALQSLILFAAVWWAWNYTAWATNWVDPERPLTALMIVVLMAVGLLMSAALPEAFDGRGLPFAVAYVVLQLIRTGFVVWAFPSGSPMRSNNARLLAWLAIGGAIWIVGALLHGDARLIVWGVAVLVDFAAPLHGFALPGLGAVPIDRWELTGTHLAERYQLLLIIALGESLLRVGLTASEQHGSVAVDVAFVAGFLASACLWAGYFLHHAEGGARAVAEGDHGARLGRSGYAYAHAAMVAGVIVVAVATRLTIDDPHAQSTVASALVTLGGPALYLVGLGAFVRSASTGTGIPALVVVAILALLSLVAVAGGTRLLVGACVTVVLLGLAGFVVRRDASLRSS